MHKTHEKLTAEDLAADDPQTLADELHIPIIWVDHQVTRRQRLHGASLPGREQAYTSTHMNEVLDHLDKEGYKHAILITETPKRKHLACMVNFHPLPEK